MNEIKLMQYIFDISENSGPVLRNRLFEIGSKKEILAVCKQLYKKGLIECEGITSSNNGENTDEWLNIRSVSLSSKGKKVIEFINRSAF